MLRSINLQLAKHLSDREFRREWFRAQLEANVPEMFRALRETRDMTQTEVAKYAGMKQSAISRFEKSTDANWKLDTLLTLADALDAQLVISVLPAEDVIARYEREESGGGTSKKSVLEVAPSESLNQKGFLSASSDSSLSVLGQRGPRRSPRPWVGLSALVRGHELIRTEAGGIGGTWN